jgi:hypothetical protein
MTRDEIDHHIAELNQGLIRAMLPYPGAELGADDERIDKWWKRLDRFRRDIELLEFLRDRLPH